MELKSPKKQLDLTSPKEIKRIIREYDFRLSKSLGQNFMSDITVLERIIDSAEISENDYVIEIGPGIGSMTNLLLQRAKKVIAIEIDKRLYPILNDFFGSDEKFSLVKADFLELDLGDLIRKEIVEDAKVSGEPYTIKVVANLPYYISTPIIMKILQYNNEIKSLTLMLQKEVAERICAKKDTKDYGILTIMCGMYAVPEIQFNVNPAVFIPPPNVDSAVIKLELRDNLNLSKEEDEKFRSIVKSSFAQRRKTLVNSLSSAGIYTKEEISNALVSLGLNVNSRAENLDIPDFLNLLRAMN